MQKRTFIIIAKMHWSHLLYSLPTTHRCCHRLRHPFSQRLQNPPIPTGNPSSKVIIRRSFYSTGKKYIRNIPRSGICSSCVFSNAYSGLHHSRTRCLHLHSVIFALKFGFRLGIHLRVLWKNIAVFKSWKTSEIRRQELLACLGMWDSAAGFVLYHYFCYHHEKRTFQKHGSCSQNSQSMLLVKLLHDLHLNILNSHLAYPLVS